MIKDEFIVSNIVEEDGLRIDKYLPTCYEEMTRSELKNILIKIKFQLMIK